VILNNLILGSVFGEDSSEDKVNKLLLFILIYSRKIRYPRILDRSLNDFLSYSQYGNGLNFALPFLR